VRSILLFVLSLALAACIGDSEPEAPLTLRPTTSDPDSLLARLDVNELAEAFERLKKTGYTAEMSIREGSSTQNTFAQTIEVSGDSIRVLYQSGSDSLADHSEPFAVFDPVARLLPKEPPFRNAATRDMYAVANFARFRDQPDPSGPIAGASAELFEGSASIINAGVRVDTTTGQVVSARVLRESLSAVYDETSEAVVHLVSRDGTWWPSTGWLLMDIDVPLSTRRVLQIEWRVLSIGGVELAADTSSTS